MKFVLIARAAPGVENQRKALETFMKVGPAQGTQALYAGADGKTYVNIIESDEPELADVYTYAPFFEKFELIPIVPVDAAWLTAVQAALANLD